MKKLVLGGMLLSALVLGLLHGEAWALPWAENDSVRISLSNIVPSYITGSGGLFTVTNLNTGASIQTFCLELNEYVYLSSIYYVQDVSDDIAWKGGRNVPPDGPFGDQLSDATKWLYYQYLSGNSSYQDPRALQIAVWVLEGEYHDKTIDDNFWNYWGLSGLGGTAKYYYTAAQGKTTTADIRVLDLKDAMGQPVQSYLIMVPETATITMLGIALLGFGVAARRLRRKI